MTTISATAVASLRQRTGVPMMACKKALEESGGNEEKAIEILRRSGEAQAIKKASREQKEGAIFVSQEGNRAAMVTLNCETDFVARNEDFIRFGQGLSDMLLTEGEDALKTYAQKSAAEMVQKLGENISLGNSRKVEAAVVGSYVHSNRKIGVIIGLSEGDSGIARDVAMHAAAMNPPYRTPEEVPASVIGQEKNIWREHLKSEGKPEQIWDKIMMGKEKKFREENSLISQEFVKEPGKKVKDHLGKAKIVEYVRFAVE